MKIMFVHGVGFLEDPSALSQWVPAWTTSIRHACGAVGVSFDFDDPFGADGKPGTATDEPGILAYEDVIRRFKAPSGPAYLAVVTGLMKSYVTTKIGELFRRERGILFDDEQLWKAREVAAWVHNDQMRAALRKRVVKEIREKAPDVVIAHSYGGLITYDACLFEDPHLMADRYYVTLGAQIGNPLLRKEFGGRQLPVKARHWFNLYNPGDRVFVAPLDHIRAENFTHLVVDHPEGHDGASYLGHPVVADRVWRAVGQGRAWLNRSRSLRSLHARTVRPSDHRALLVGIDAYASPEVPPLKGCVNDTFHLSAALQESGIGPKSIRLLHNARATRENLIHEMRWLLDDARPGDHRFLSFSGHGHRMAAYDAGGDPDEMEEILVTHDYAFTHTTGLRDRDFQDLYAHLPREVHFLIFLDCCHSGGITRSDGPLVRSFMGPTDLEHEYLRWNADLQMWEQMGLAGKKGINPEFYPPRYKSRAFREKEHALYYGRSGDIRRIGRATPLRDISHKKFDGIAKRLRALHPEVDSGGPYLPLVFMACGEVEKACEYVHGAVSYGAFTYAMVQALRDTRLKGGRALSYAELLAAAAGKLAKLGYTQNPEILGHERQKAVIAPFGAGAMSAKSRKPSPERPKRKTTKKTSRAGRRSKAKR